MCTTTPSFFLNLRSGIELVNLGVMLKRFTNQQISPAPVTPREPRLVQLGGPWLPQPQVGPPEFRDSPPTSGFFLFQSPGLHPIRGGCHSLGYIGEEGLLPQGIFLP